MANPDAKAIASMTGTRKVGSHEPPNHRRDRPADLGLPRTPHPAEHGHTRRRDHRCRRSPCSVLDLYYDLPETRWTDVDAVNERFVEASGVPGLIVEGAMTRPATLEEIRDRR